MIEVASALAANADFLNCAENLAEVRKSGDNGDRNAGVSQELTAVYRLEPAGLIINRN